MMIPDELLERFAAEYTRKSTADWEMSFREYVEMRMEKHELKLREISLEMNHGKKK